MQIEIKNLGKKFHHEWIFRNVNITLTSHEACVFVGPNGSGKSTLMLIITGMLLPTQGEILYKNGSQTIPDEHFYQQQSIVAPYMEVIEEFTLHELLDFHFSFKSPLPEYNTHRIMQAMHLERAKNKYIKQFSSGMKQRLKLGLAFYAQSPILYLDEPCSNLDTTGIQWYRNEVQKALRDKLIVICSNQSYEYDFAKKIINIEQYK